MSYPDSTLRKLLALVTIALLVALPSALRAQTQPTWPGHDCTSYCWVGDCVIIPGQIEVAAPWEGGPLANSRLAVAQYCHPGICDVGCEQSIAHRALVPGILASVASGNIGELDVVVATHPHTVVLNLARQAIQVTGCFDNQLVASIPVPPVELAALQRAIASRAADVAASSTGGSSAVALLLNRWQ